MKQCAQETSRSQPGAQSTLQAGSQQQVLISLVVFQVVPLWINFQKHHQHTAPGERFFKIVEGGVGFAQRVVYERKVISRDIAR